MYCKPSLNPVCRYVVLLQINRCPDGTCLRFSVKINRAGNLSSIYNSLFVPIPPSSPTLLCAASTRVFALSSVTPLPRIFLSCQIFQIPFAPSAITSFGNGAFSSTARPLIASNRVYNPRYSEKCIASHL